MKYMQWKVLKSHSKPGNLGLPTGPELLLSASRMEYAWNSGSEASVFSSPALTSEVKAIINKVSQNMLQNVAFCCFIQGNYRGILPSKGVSRYEMWLFVFIEVETTDQHPKASAIVKQTFTEPGDAWGTGWMAQLWRSWRSEINWHLPSFWPTEGENMIHCSSSTWWWNMTYDTTSKKTKLTHDLAFDNF